jgi:calcineurin-like phosphoesterase family protein
MSNRTFFISDLHFGHRAVAKMRWDTQHPDVMWGDMPDADRVVQWHDEMLVKNWRQTVNEQDKIYVAGDLSMQGKANTENALAIIKDLPGKKILVPGNHDEIHPGVTREWEKWEDRYRAVFDGGMPLFVRRKIAGQNVLISHFPYQGGGDHTEVERFGQYRLPFLGEWLLHGHTHSSNIMWSSPEYAGSHRQIHIGVDSWNYFPVNMDEIAAIIESQENHGIHKPLPELSEQ